MELTTNLLARLIDEKHKVLVQLVDLSRRQLALAEGSEEVNPLLSVLAVKQQLISRLMGLEKLLDPFRAQDPDSREWPTPADRRRCAERADNCRELLEELMQMEQDGMDHLCQRRDLAAAQLQTVSAADQARKAYGSPDGPRQSSFDLTSDQ